MSIVLAIVMVLCACSKEILVAGVDLSEWKEAAEKGQTFSIPLLSACGTGKGFDFDIYGLSSDRWNKELFEVLYRLEMKESDFQTPTSFEKGEFFYKIAITQLEENENGTNPAVYYFRFYEEFRFLVVSKNYDTHISSWKIENPELIKDFFVKYEMYQKTP